MYQDYPPGSVPVLISSYSYISFIGQLYAHLILPIHNSSFSYVTTTVTICLAQFQISQTVNAICPAQLYHHTYSSPFLITIQSIHIGMHNSHLINMPHFTSHHIHSTQFTFLTIHRYTCFISFLIILNHNSTFSRYLC